MSDRLFKTDILFFQRLLKSSGLYTGKLDGIWGPKTEAAVTAFENQSTDIAATYGTFDSRSEINIYSLHLEAQKAARIFMNALRDAGIGAKIISGTRTYLEQNDLFRKGRYGNPPPIVTNARGGSSNHNFGIAWDIGLFTQSGGYITKPGPYNEAAQIAMAAQIPGMEWGGHWTGFVDPPHYQLASNLRLSEVRDRFEKGLPYI
ncbi:MAG TPA: M15 family metallopeptidase [Saprospiraceae bacterium]|nr:M15 family metallopeptidase [Saprospiraceae bacterium]